MFSEFTDRIPGQIALQ